MTQTIEFLRSKNCLSGFRCGVKEIDQFCKNAFKKHNQPKPPYRVRVLYDDDEAVGMYTLSMSTPNENGRVLDTKSVYSGTSVFLYLDHLAVAASRRGEGASNKLMVSLIENLNSTLSSFGSVFAVALNAADKDAVSFFEKWGFVRASDSETPFMVMDRASVMALWQQILDVED